MLSSGVIVVAVVMISEILSNSYCNGSKNFTWVPPVIKDDPIMIFFNDDIYNPSWKKYINSPHQIHLQLPENIPFSIFCGACFNQDYYNRNYESLFLNISTYPYDVDLVPVMREHNNRFFSVGTDNKCLISYMITEPLKKSSWYEYLDCSLYDGEGEISKDAKISFKVIWVNTTEPEIINETAAITALENNNISCPKINDENNNNNDDDEKANPIVNVWTINEGEGIVPSMNTVLTDDDLYFFHKNNNNAQNDTITITCSAYNIYHLKNVKQTKYIIPFQSFLNHYYYYKNHENKGISLYNRNSIYNTFLFYGIYYIFLKIYTS